MTGTSNPSRRDQFDMFASAMNTKQVAAGAEHTLALQQDGTVWAWGDNTYGQLGDGTTNSSTTPVQVIGLIGVVAIAAGDYHNMALQADGSVWTWGSNSHGQLGDNSHVAYRDIPVLAFPMDATAISASPDHSMAMTITGEVWCWGSNTGGKLGFGSWLSYTSHYPTRLPSSEAFTAIAAGPSESITVNAAGEVYAWFGYGYQTMSELYNCADIETDGETYLCLTNGGTVYSHQPWLGNSGTVSGLTGIKAIAQNYHSLALKSDGTLWAWGGNAFGQCGNGTTEDKESPGQVGVLTNVVSMAAGQTHSVAILSDGTVWTWGNNSSGQLGDGTTINRLTPVQVSFGGFVPPVPASINLQLTPNALVIPTMGTVTAVALGRVYDAAGFQLSGQTVSYSLLSDAVGVSIHSATGVVTVQSSAVTGTVTVVAECDSVMSTADLTLVRPDPDMVSVVLTPGSVIVSSTAPVTAAAAATVYDGAGNVKTEQTVTWSLEAPVAGVSIDSVTGVVTVQPETTNGSVVVKATCGSVSGTAVLSVNKKVYVKTIYWDDSRDKQIDYDGGYVIAGFNKVLFARTLAWYTLSKNSPLSVSLPDIQEDTTYVFHYNAFEPRQVALALSETSVAIPAKGSANATVSSSGRVLDYLNADVTSVFKLTYKLEGAPAGVFIDAATGQISVSSDAAGGIVTVTAACGDVTGSVSLTLTGTGSGVPLSPSLVLSVSKDNDYAVSLRGKDVTSFMGKTYTLTYDPTKLTLTDFAAQTAQFSTSGIVLGTPLTITSHVNGVLKFTVNRTIQNGKYWNGSITVLKFIAIETGSTTVSVA